MDHLLNLGTALQQPDGLSSALAETSQASNSSPTRGAKSPEAEYLPISGAFSAGETRKKQPVLFGDPLQSKSVVDKKNKRKTINICLTNRVLHFRNEVRDI